VAADAAHINCPLCSAAHEVIRRQGMTILYPMSAKSSPFRQTLSAKQPVLEEQPAVVQEDEFFTASLINQFQDDQERQDAEQEILLLETQIKHNDALIKHNGTSEIDIRNGMTGLILSMIAGAMAEFILQNQVAFPYDKGPLILILAVLAGILWLSWCWFTSLARSSQIGSLCYQENQQILSRIQSLQAAKKAADLDLWARILNGMKKLFIPKIKRQQKQNWTCAHCGTLNRADAILCEKCRTIRKQKRTAKKTIVLIALIIMLVCLLMQVLILGFSFLLKQVPLSWGLESLAVSNAGQPENSGSTDQSPVNTESSVYPNPPVDGCVLWSEITAANAGETHCVYGVIFDRLEDDQQHTHFRFSDENNAFRMVMLNNENVSPGKGDCIYQSGEIMVYGALPYMDISETVLNCEK
jgi:hypothetical protein